MTTTFVNATRIRRLRSALLLLVMSLAISCATTMPAPQAFLNSQDAALNQWLDTRLNVDIAEVRVMHLPLTDAFAGMKMAITKADAPVEFLRVTLYADNVTRRQALWLLTRKYGFQMIAENVPGYLPTSASRNSRLVSRAGLQSPPHRYRRHDRALKLGAAIPGALVLEFRAHGSAHCPDPGPDEGVRARRDRGGGA